jgi:hypothetical protein
MGPLASERVTHQRRYVALPASGRVCAATSRSVRARRHRPPDPPMGDMGGGPDDMRSGHLDESDSPAYLTLNVLPVVGGSRESP